MWGDVAVDSQETLHMVRFHLKQKKSEQLRKGVDAVVGWMDRHLCPVAAILATRRNRQGLFMQSGENEVHVGSVVEVLIYCLLATSFTCIGLFTISTFACIGILGCSHP